MNSLVLIPLILIGTLFLMLVSSICAHLRELTFIGKHFVQELKTLRITIDDYIAEQEQREINKFKESLISSKGITGLR